MKKKVKNEVKVSNIVINHKFRENHKNQDVSKQDVENIRDRVFSHAKQSLENLNKISKFRK